MRIKFSNKCRFISLFVALLSFALLGAFTFFEMPVSASISYDGQNGDGYGSDCRSGTQSFISGNGIDCHRKNTWPGSHTNAGYITRDYVKQCCYSKNATNNEMWNRCNRPNKMHYGVITEGTSTYSITSASGTTNLSATGYHFGCGNDITWYATRMEITSNCANNAISLNQYHLYEGQGYTSYYGWFTGSTDNVFRADNAKIAAQTGNTGSYTCTITIKVCASPNSSDCNGEWHSHTLSYRFNANIANPKATCTKRYRLQNADGTYPSSYTAGGSESLEVGSTCNYQQSATGYVTKSTSGTVTASGITLSLDLPRNTYTCYKQYRLQNADGSYPSSYTSDGSETLRWGQTCSYSKSVDGYVSPQSKSETMGQANKTLSLDFPRTTYTCYKRYRLENANGTWGDWINDGSVAVRWGGTCSYSKSVTNYQTKSASITMNKADATVEVSLPRNTYTLTVDRDTNHISSVSGGGTYRWGQSVSIGATAIADHAFSNWTLTSGSGTIGDTNSASTTFTMTTSNATVKANGYTYTHTLKYDANGGSGAPSTQSKSNIDENYTFTVNATVKPTRDNYVFLGWATTNNATTVGYNPGSSIVVGKNATVTLYAVWQSTATFTGSVGTISSNNDSRLVGASGANLLGNGSSTQFNIKTSYTITRTNSIPTSATSKYTTSCDSQPSSTSTTSNAMTNGQSQTITTGNTKTVTQSVGTSGTHCCYLTYDNTVKYVQTTRGAATIDKQSGCTTLYNPQYATFGSSIEVSSTNMTGNSANGFRGTGYSDMDYNLTAYFKIKRTNGSPNAAVSRYAYSTNSTHPTAPSSNSDSLTNGNYTTVPVTITFRLTPGATAQTKCFSLSFDNRVGYIGDNMLTSPFDTREFNGRNQLCVSVYNPVRRTATFAGSITAANGNALTGSGNSRTGNGLHSQYALTPTYTVKRTNNSPTWGVAPQYAYSDSGYPTTASGTMKSLKHNETDSKTGGAKTVAVNIDGKSTQCFYLSYDDQVIYLDTDLNERVFGGRKSECYEITNPHQAYSSHYSSTTVGTIDEHERLVRSDGNHMGVIDNQTRITGTNTDTDGSFRETYPTSDKYTASFTHTISRTDQNKSSTAGTIYYVNSARTTWQVQYCEDIGCEANVYMDYTASKDNNSNVKVSGTFYLAAGASDTVTTKPKWTLNSANKGTVVRTCQRIRYDSVTEYNTATNTSNRDSYVDKIVSRTESYSAPVCVTIRNPNWSNNIVKDYNNHYIDVDGQTGDLVISGARHTGGVNYETTELNAKFLYNHSLTRHDNYNVSGRNTTNFDETDSWVHFYQPSIYNNNNYAVTTKMWGYERLPDTRNTAKAINPVYNTNSTINGLPVTLNARNKSSGDTWNSNSANGRTETIFNSTATGDYSLLAGQTKKMSQSTYNTRAAWRVQYKNVYRRENYSGWAASMTGSQFYDRTEKVNAKSRQCILPDGTDRECGTTDTIVTPGYRDSANPTTYYVTRPYHYIVTNVQPSSKPSTVTYNGQEFGRTFNIDVARPTSDYNYITDMRDHRAFVIEYKIPAGTSLSAVNNVIVGGITGSSDNITTDVCNSFYASKLPSIYGCKVVENGTKKITPKTNNPNNNYVYGSESYRISYTTGSIKVPKINLGDKYCIALVIAKYSSSSNNWYISKSACSNTSKRPMVHVLGGDVRSDGHVTGSITEYEGKKYGSWSDFIVSASGKIARFGSSASIANGTTGSDSSLMCKISSLTIANEQCKNNPLSTELGDVNIPMTNSAENILKKVQDYYLVAGDDRDANGCDSVSCLIETSNITESTFTSKGLRSPTNFIASKPIVLYSAGSIDINTNIKLEEGHVYNDGTTPQIIIIAEQDIRVSESVTRLDAWIIAGGKFVSCIEAGNNHSNLSANVCKNQLVIKGAIAAESLDLNRTFGGDPNAASTVTLPAEKIYYSPMTLIHAARDAARDAEPQTTYINELSPRY